MICLCSICAVLKIQKVTWQQSRSRVTELYLPYSWRVRPINYNAAAAFPAAYAAAAVIIIYVLLRRSSTVEVKRESSLVYSDSQQGSYPERDDP